ncbi:MAG: DUF6150 family protein [bacterium]
MNIRLLGLLITTLFFISIYDASGQRFYETETVEAADFTVYAVWEVEQCDLKVCFVYEEQDATEPGRWMEVPEPEQADIKIIFVDDEALADLKLFVVDACPDAGWHTTGKEELLKFK